MRNLTPGTLRSISGTILNSERRAISFEGNVASRGFVKTMRAASRGTPRPRPQGRVGIEPPEGVRFRAVLHDPDPLRTHPVSPDEIAFELRRGNDDPVRPPHHVGFRGDAQEPVLHGRRGGRLGVVGQGAVGVEDVGFPQGPAHPQPGPRGNGPDGNKTSPGANSRQRCRIARAVRCRMPPDGPGAK